MTIVGAGLAGLITAHMVPGAEVVEQMPQPTTVHQALLRFRSGKIGELTGIDFRPVTVRKGIWADERWHGPSISLANAYSRKVLGSITDRSIWDIETAVRWVAPLNFYDQLIERVWRRIQWGVNWHFADNRPNAPVISTAPLSVAAAHIDHHLSFTRQPISVRRFTLDRTDVYQTVYFPSAQHSLYRASITGNLLICEFASEARGEWLEDVWSAFALRSADLSPELAETRQPFGKIAPIDEQRRRALILRLSEQYGVFSVGRYATWRNILLDDVIHDVTVVRQLINASSYERRIHTESL